MCVFRIGPMWILFFFLFKGVWKDILANVARFAIVTNVSFWFILIIWKLLKIKREHIFFEFELFRSTIEFLLFDCRLLLLLFRPISFWKSFIWCDIPAMEHWLVTPHGVCLNMLSLIFHRMQRPWRNLPALDLLWMRQKVAGRKIQSLERYSTFCFKKSHQYRYNIFRAVLRNVLIRFKWTFSHVQWFILLNASNVFASYSAMICGLESH